MQKKLKWYLLGISLFYSLSLLIHSNSLSFPSVTESIKVTNNILDRNNLVTQNSSVTKMRNEG